MNINETHSHHLSSLFATRAQLDAVISKVNEESEYLYSMQTSFISPTGKACGAAEFFSVQMNDGPLSLRFLVHADKDNGVNNIASLFPVGSPLPSCPSVSITDHEVKSWSNRIEAVLEAETLCEEGHCLSFFSTDYLRDKYLVRQVESADYDLVAFAVNCRVVSAEEQEIRFEGERAQSFLYKLGKKSTILDNGEVEPVIISTKNMVSFFQMDKENPDMAEFCSPVSDVEALTAFGVPMYRMKITLYREDEGDVQATLYARQDFFESMPAEGDSLRGHLWLQGQTKTDLFKKVCEADSEGVASQLSTAFFDAISGTNFREYNDLMGLLKPFTELTTRPGYVIDGCHAVRDENHIYTKLYFSEEDSTWEYQPNEDDGEASEEFDDRMYIMGSLDERLTEKLPPLTDYIEGPFTESAIWSVYLLMRAQYLLPMTEQMMSSGRVLINRKRDFCRISDERLTRFACDERFVSGVRLISSERALVSSAFWSEEQGLCAEKIIVSRQGNGYKFERFWIETPEG